MRAIEISKANILDLGYTTGKAIRGKGTEIFSIPKACHHLWTQYDDGKYTEDSILRAKKQIEKYGVENLFAMEVSVSIDGYGTKLYNFNGNEKESIKRFNLKKMVERDFKGINRLSIYFLPKMIGYVSLSKVKSNLEDQQEMLKDIIEKSQKIKIVDGFKDNEDEGKDKCIEFSSYRSSDIYERDGDYTLYHGQSLCLNDEHVECIDGRIYYYNEDALDSFWNFTMDDDPFNFVDEDGHVSVYARKGKDWYVTSSIEQELIYITYRDDDGDLIEEEEYYYHYNLASDDLVADVENVVRGMIKDVEIRSCINNALHYGNEYGGYDYSDDLFNLKILKKQTVYDNMYEVGNCIIDHIIYNGGSIIEIVSGAYERFLSSNMVYKNKDDVDSYNCKLFGRYKHLMLLAKIVEQNGKELVYTQIGDFTDEKAWAIKYNNEEYHFSLYELFETSPMRLYNTATSKLSKRLSEINRGNILMREAKSVFVGIDDSHDSGNCISGTASFCRRFKIDTSVVGGIRGDALLEMDYSDFTKRAILHAIKKRR